MMNIIIFEDTLKESLKPFSINHSPVELRVGAFTNIERILNLFPNSNIFLYVRESISDILKKKYPNFIINPEIIPEGLCLNACGIYNIDSLEILKKYNNLSNKDRILSFHQNQSIRIEEFQNKINKTLSVSVKCDIQIINNIWDIFDITSKNLILDFELFNINNEYVNHHSVIKVNEDKIHIGENTILNPGVVLDASKGPIIIDKNVIISHNAVIEGPVYIGENSIINNLSNIKGNTIIGPMCKIAGEVSFCNFLGYSNKAHDGFLGHSYIGEWVNIGAGTNCSNLKNNYNNITLSIENENYNTGLQFLGSLIGDYSRLAISTVLNTGTYIGLGSNIFNHNFLKKYVPSFSWGDSEVVELDKLLSTISSMKERRNQEFLEEEIDLLKKIYKI